MYGPASDGVESFLIQKQEVYLHDLDMQPRRSVLVQTTV
jgi:hypothetical protein